MDRHADPVVSFEDEPLILVDSDDNEIGHGQKGACHDGEGQLHRAFSVFLFDRDGRLLLHQRSQQKRLWPLIWTNSCCSHPRRGEAVPAAAGRRVREELGVEAALAYVFKFEYHARYGDIGSEHELCWVFVGRVEGEPEVNANEIAQWRFVDPDWLDEQLIADAARYSPWIALEWPRLRAQHWPAIERVIAGR